VIEANIDDSTPQVLAYAMERLFETGALDVTLETVYMKKNRPGTKLTVLSVPAMVDQLAAVLFEETSTLGVRFHQAERRVQSRTVSAVETSFGSVRVKQGANGSYAPEFEDCRRLAIEHKVPLRAVIAEASHNYRKGI